MRAPFWIRITVASLFFLMMCVLAMLYEVFDLLGIFSVRDAILVSMEGFSNWSDEIQGRLK